MYAPPSVGVASNNEILSNTVTNIRGAGITLSRDDTFADVSGNNISGNRISSANTLGYDGAGVYTINVGGSLPTSANNIIQGNTIRNCGSSYLRSAGIMVDNGSGSMTIINNTIENNSKGGIVVSGPGHLISNNTLRNNGVASWNNAEIIFFTAGAPASNCTVTGNSMEADQDHHFVFVNAGNGSGHTINNNTYLGQSVQQFYWPGQWMDFDTWKSATGYDADSVFNSSPPKPTASTLAGIYLLL